MQEEALIAEYRGHLKNDAHLAALAKFGELLFRRTRQRKGSSVVPADVDTDPALEIGLLHLVEIDRRGLHLAKGCSSLFGYCVERLGFSEDIAYKRVGGARYCRRFPLALDLVAQGSLHLSALMLIGPHLTDANHREWLMAAGGTSKREVEKLVATRCPKPEGASSVRKLPQRQPPAKPAAALALRAQAQEGPDCDATMLSTNQLSESPIGASKSSETTRGVNQSNDATRG